MIAGLLSTSAQNTIDKAPGAGDIPILGALFKSTQFQKGQTELVIVVTPYLVKPVDDSQIALPTDGYASPDAFSQWLGNIDNAGVSGAKRPGPRPAQEETPPQVSAADQSAESRRLPGDGGEQRAEAATPGFSIK
jgi:pilus assembly protein CpaC